MEEHDPGEGSSGQYSRFGDHNSGLQIGNANKDVTIYNTINRGKASRDPTKGVYTVPYSTDPAFVARGDILDQIRRRIFPINRGGSGSRAALVGNGGVGKSQLAISFAEDTHRRHPERSVFWISSGTKTRVEEEFGSLANMLDLEGRNDPKVYTPQIVHDWLRDDSNGPWLVIVDSCDDEDVLYAVAPDDKKSNRRPLATYLPTSPHGAILVTTRSESVASKMAGDRSQPIRIGVMTEFEALELFRNKTKAAHTDSDTKTGNADDADRVSLSLVKELGLMPLAISQAASYILKNRPFTSPQQYLDAFRTSEKNQVSLLTETEELRQEDGKPNSVFTTWQMSFDRLLARRPSAAKLLSLMSFFDAQSIPLFLLSNSSNSRHGRIIPDVADGYNAESDDAFQKDVVILCDYSLISLDGSKNISMHHLVQLCTMTWLQNHGQNENFTLQGLQRLALSFVGRRPYSDHAMWRKLYPHLQWAASRRPLSTEECNLWVTVLSWGANSAWDIGDYAMSREVVAKCTEVAETQEASVDALGGWKVLSDTHKLLFNFEKSELLDLKILDGIEQLVGKENSAWLDSLVSLADNYKRRGRYQEAEQSYLRAEAVCRKVKDKSALETLTLKISNGLASLYAERGQYVKAEQLCEQMLACFERSPENNSFEVQSAREILVRLYIIQRRYDKAEQLQLRVMEVTQKDPGQAHYHRVHKQTLVNIYVLQGRFQDAEEICLQNKKDLQEQLGAGHLETLAAMHALAGIYASQGRTQEARDTLEECCRVGHKSLGFDDPNMLTVTQTLAGMYVYLGPTGKGVELMEECVQVSKRVLGPEHRKTVERVQQLNAWKLDATQTRNGRSFWRWIMGA